MTKQALPKKIRNKNFKPTMKGKKMSDNEETTVVDLSENKTVVKKPVAKKTTAKKTVAKKTTAKKTVAKKTTAKEPAVKLEKRNGISRPAPGGKTTDIWELADKLGKKAGGCPKRKDVMEQGLAEGWNKHTITRQFQLWRKFYGYSNATSK